MEWETVHPDVVEGRWLSSLIPRADLLSRASPATPKAVVSRGDEQSAFPRPDDRQAVGVGEAVGDEPPGDGHGC
jgi:hypothetical protein